MRLTLCYRRHMPTPASSVGPLLREWRQRRRLSQLALACEAEVSSRHVSFLSKPFQASMLAAKVREALTKPR